ncbi:MAG: hypothetical protein QXX38_00900 [Candidatus Aenigmatarchaeota archaeon]
MEKKSLIAIFFIILMVFSTFTFISFRTTEKNKINLPEKNIVDYELGPEKEMFLIENGKTIIKYYYQKNCIECREQINFLEEIANRFPDQIFLQEVLENYTSLTIKSYRGEKKIKNITKDVVFDVVCDLIVKPPVACIVRKV